MKIKIMKIECVENTIEYSRNIEGMGDELILFKIKAVNRYGGQNYHLFFEDKRKPPLDIAINPNSGTIEYFSFFTQDEKIIEREVKNSIQYRSGVITIEDDSFNVDHPHIRIEKKFEIVKSNEDIFVLCVDLLNAPMQAYRVDEFNYLLFADNYEFAGALLKKITEKELKEIQRSNCL
ncbi:MAG: hypothetical protein NC399_08360 [Muribaculum sp.]|nr:hypothetical protein [Muribaculum sp.]